METEQQIKNIIKGSKKEYLSPQEKEAIKSHLIHFIKQHPAQAPRPAVFTWLGLIQAINARPALRYVSLVAMVVLVGGGSVAFAAQNAQPGEFLYSVKTGVSEKVLALTLFSDQAKAEYTINLAQLRLQETETAAAQDKLNDQTTAEVRLLFNDHVTDIQNKIVKINAKEDARVSLRLNSQLEALLKAHAKIIDTMAGKKQGSQATAIKNILSDVESKTGEITKNRQESESRVSLQASENAKVNAENKIQEADAELQEAEALIVGAIVSEHSRQKARTDLVAVRQSITEGNAKLATGDYTGAFIIFQNAVRLAQEINIYISNESKLKLQFNLPGALINTINQ